MKEIPTGRNGSPGRSRRFRRKRPTRHAGFTLIEVILVLVVIIIISGIAIPHFSGAFRGNKLRSSARTINRMARYARSMAIMRETTMSIVLNRETMEIYLGAAAQASTNAADGELDQDVLKRLGYVEGNTSSGDIGIEKEVRRFLPEDIEVADFETNWQEDEEDREDLDIINYYSDGQSDWFILKLQDQRGLGVELENDPVSGKIRSEFMQ
ncbi:MAG: prepilin-type N-terminal cleavage/methylation domain-containing protein [Verrucomicrobiota bacterium]